MKLLKDWRKIDVNGEPVLQHVNLLNQKTTADDDDEGLLHLQCDLLHLRCGPNPMWSDAVISHTSVTCV